MAASSMVSMLTPGWVSAVRVAAPILSYTLHLPTPVTVVALAAFVVPPTLLAVVVLVGTFTKDQERRTFCERAMTRLSYRRSRPHG